MNKREFLKFMLAGSAGLILHPKRVLGQQHTPDPAPPRGELMGQVGGEQIGMQIVGNHDRLQALPAAQVLHRLAQKRQGLRVVHVPDVLGEKDPPPRCQGDGVARHRAEGERWLHRSLQGYG